MRLAILLFLGTLAAVLSMAAVGGSILIRAGGGRDKLIESVGGIAAALCWGLVALGATNITQVSNGTVVQTANEPLSFLAIAFAAIMLFVALFGTISLVDVSDVQVSR